MPSPTCIATISNAVPFGGSKRATALSLNFRPYRAIHVFHRRPRFFGSIGTTTILTQGTTSLQFVKLGSGVLGWLK